jgi:Flp pilus assembly secretin CpaC
MRTAIIAISMLASTAAFGQPDMHVTEGFVKQFEFTGEPIASISIGDTAVADVLPLSEHSFLVQSHKIGHTNMILFDRNKQVVDEIIVTVDRPMNGLVRIHNKAMLNSYTEFSCAPNGCQFVGENTVNEPAPLPRGHFHGTYDHNSSGPQQAPAVPAVVEPQQ